jgi:hypothetical protein
MAQGFAPAPILAQKSIPNKAAAAEAQSIQSRWLWYFESLDDPRGGQGQRHPFLSIVIIAILATIGGAKGWEDIELYAEAQQEWLGTFLDLPHGVPKADCYRRLFVRIEPEALHHCFQQWIDESSRKPEDKWCRAMAKRCVVLMTGYRSSPLYMW